MFTSHGTSGLTDKGLQGYDQVTGQLLSRSSQHVYPSERRVFATKCLGISEPQYEMIEEDERFASARNFKVNILRHYNKLSFLYMNSMTQKNNVICNARIRAMGEVLFSQVSVCPQRGTQVPGSLPGHWSQVLSRRVGTPGWPYWRFPDIFLSQLNR